jgi:hypothetical protein
MKSKKKNRAKKKKGKSRRTLPGSGARDIAAREHTSKIATDPLLAAQGSGKELWRDEHADEYVRRLREDWD